MEDDSEWEYEYDENETEDLYFTLDLTTHVPDAVPIAKTSRNGKLVPNLAPPVREQTLLAPGKLQILDLHTSNPFVKFNDGVYSCHWHTDLGTQVHVADQGAIADPVRKGYVLDIVGTSQTRLLAEPVSLIARPGQVDLTGKVTGEAASPKDAAATLAPTSSAQTLPPSDLSTLRPGQKLIVPPEAVKNPVMAAQASFFERLSAIKLAKGENDIIPVGAVKFYAPPADKDEIRQQALAAAGHQETAATEITTVQPEGKGRKRSHGEMGASGSGESPQSATNAERPSSVPVTPRLFTRPSSAQQHIQRSSSTVQYALPGQDLSPGRPPSTQIKPPTATKASTRAQQHFSQVPYSLPSSFPPEETLGRTIPWHAMPRKGEGNLNTISPQAPQPPQSHQGGALADLLRQPQSSTLTARPSTSPARSASRGSGVTRIPD